MDKKKLNELKDKVVKASKEEFNNMKSAGSDIKEAVKNKNIDNIKNKDSKSKKKFYLGIVGFILIIFFVIGMFSDDESASDGDSSDSMCKGKYYYIEMVRGESVEGCSNKCYYFDNKVPTCTYGFLDSRDKIVEYFEDRTNK